MDVEDDAKGGSVSSAILESLESSQKIDKLSAEDLAWVDSCLISDTEILEKNWTSFKDVLFEIIGDQPESFDSSASGSDGFADKTEMKIVPSIEESETANYSERTDDDLVIPINGDNETNTDGILIKKRNAFLSQAFQEDSTETFRGDPFLPNYNEDGRSIEAIDLGLDLSLFADEMNSSTVDIFKVWDLNIPAEEDGLTKQLSKAIAETPLPSMPSAFDDSMAWKDLKDEPLDKLIASIADLSLDISSS